MQAKAEDKELHKNRLIYLIKEQEKLVEGLRASLDLNDATAIYNYRDCINSLGNMYDDLALFISENISSRPDGCRTYGSTGENGSLNTRC